MSAALRVRYIEIQRFDWEQPQYVFLQTLPTMRPNHYRRTIKVFPKDPVYTPGSVFVTPDNRFTLALD